MDAPVVEFPRGLRKGVECSRRPQEDTLQPDGKGLDGLCRCTGLGVDFDDMGGVSRAVVLGEAGHRTLFQLFDPFNFSLKAVADIDGEPGIFGVKDIPFRASLKGVSVGFDEILKSIDPSVELAHFGHVIVFSLLNCFEQRFSDALQGVGVEVGAAVKDVSGRSG